MCNIATKSIRSLFGRVTSKKLKPTVINMGPIWREGEKEKEKSHCTDTHQQQQQLYNNGYEQCVCMWIESEISGKWWNQICWTTDRSFCREKKNAKLVIVTYIQDYSICYHWNTDLFFFSLRHYFSTWGCDSLYLSSTVEFVSLDHFLVGESELNLWFFFQFNRKPWKNKENSDIKFDNLYFHEL